MTPENTTGSVFLVGAGPGDPGLLTLKGLACIRRADVLIYDYLAAPALLAHASEKAEKIYVGKKGGDHTLSQEGINALIVEKALAGRTVTRLKGGDPFIFGRGGEEAEVLAKAGIPFEIVPGVTSAIAAPAYAGIPLTHRRWVSSLTFVTGHEDPVRAGSRIDWQALATGGGTLVFLMGVKNLPHIIRHLSGNGLSPQTPVALVRWGTTARQVTVTGRLENIVQRVAEANLKAPAVIVVGEVVSLRKELKWFESRPLWGRRVVVTRARQQASELVTRLSELGADYLEVPTIEIVPPEDWQPLDQALRQLDTYDWIVFTSVNGVAFFFERLFAAGRDARALGGLQTAVIGPATARRLRGYGITADVVPENYRAESVAAAFAHQRVHGKKILLPRARQARPVLPEELTCMGAEVHEIAVYDTRLADGDQHRLVEALENGRVDVVTFTSSSTVRNFRRLLPDDRFKSLTRNLTIASIGPITTRTAGELGFTVHIQARRYTVDGLCDAIVEHYHDSQTHR